MATLNNNVAIKIPISEQTVEGYYNDAIYLSPSEFAAISDEELEALKAERVANWVATIQEMRANPQPPVEPLIYPPPKPDNLG